MSKPFVSCVHYIGTLVRLEDGTPVVLAKHQRKILDHVLTPRDARLPYTTVVWSEPKKSGKTAVAAWVASWVLNTLGPRAEVLVVGNDQEQGQERLFKEVLRVQQAHPTLKRRIVRSTESTMTLDDGSTLRVVALDAPGEAGANPSAVFHDESWGIMSERARRLYDELTPPPTRPLGFRWVSSYAGYSGESLTLEQLYERGLAGKKVWLLPDCRAAGSLFVYWSHTPRMAWQTRAYYAAQRQELRPNAFLRLHENRWVSSEGAWLTAAQLERAIDRAVVQRAPLPGVRYVAFVDNSGGSNDDMVLAVGHVEGGARVVDGVWSQDGKVPFDPVKAIEKFAGVCQAYGVGRVWGDTYGGSYFMREYLNRGVMYEVCPLHPSALYELSEAGFNRGDIRLPNHARLVEQLNALREKGGKITHAYGGHDDFSNAACGVLWLMSEGMGRVINVQAEVLVGGPRQDLTRKPFDQILVSRGRSPADSSWFDRVQTDASLGGAYGGGRKLPDW